MKDVVLPAVASTSEGLRDALFDEINGLRAGTTTVQRAKTVAMLAARVIESIRAQVQVQKLMTGDSGHAVLGAKAHKNDGAKTSPSKEGI